MGSLLFAAGAAVVMVAIQEIWPGRAVYQYGWYNAIVAASIAYALFRMQALRRSRPGLTGAAALLLLGAGVVAFAGIASGLLGPGPHTVVGAPGSTVHDADLGGSLVFPFLQSDHAGTGSVTVDLRRAGAVQVAIPPNRRRYVGGFILWQRPRSVVHVSVRDARGNHLTITQPTNSVFLSPVLLMAQSTTIAGMTVPFDSFAVPAAARQVKAVLFSVQQAAQLHANPPLDGLPAVLFAVSTSGDQVLPGGIGIVADGSSRSIGGLNLTAKIASYPSIVVVSAPSFFVLWIGMAIFLAGTVRLAIRYRAGA